MTRFEDIYPGEGGFRLLPPRCWRLVQRLFRPQASLLDAIRSEETFREACKLSYRLDAVQHTDHQQANIELFRSFLPQLCYRAPSSSHEAVAKLVGAPNEFVMEEKLDGERMQLHMRGNGAQWCYWSRKAKDYSETSDRSCLDERV
jgi:DNA ligase-4